VRVKIINNIKGTPSAKNKKSGITNKLT